MRKLILTWKEDETGHVCDEPFIEGEAGSFPVGHPDPVAWGIGCLDRWNGSLRPRERARRYQRAEVVELPAAAAVSIAHDWHKTNLVTIEFRGRYFDAYRCRRCEITGKRFGLGDITRDPEFRPAGFETCNGAQKLLKRRADPVRPKD